MKYMYAGIGWTNSYPLSAPTCNCIWSSLFDVLPLLMKEPCSQYWTSYSDLLSGSWACAQFAWKTSFGCCKKGIVFNWVLVLGICPQEKHWTEGLLIVESHSCKKSTHRVHQIHDFKALWITKHLSHVPFGDTCKRMLLDSIEISKYLY